MLCTIFMLQGVSCSHQDEEDATVINTDTELALAKNNTDGLLFKLVANDVNECVFNIIQKYELKEEAKKIYNSLENQTFIDTMQFGNNNEVREAIKDVTRDLIDRLGQNTDFIYLTMPDAVLEWIRVSALVMTVDYDKLNFTRSGNMLENMKYADTNVTELFENLTLEHNAALANLTRLHNATVLSLAEQLNSTVVNLT